MSNDIVSKSWFAVLNNPQDHGYTGTPEDICVRLRDEWTDNSETRTGAWAYCVSADGLHHVHMVLEDIVAMRFSIIKKAYAAGAHFERTRGSKAQAEAYILKLPPHDEKGEKVLYVLRHGEISGRQGKRSDLDEINNLINDGMTPTEIMNHNIRFRRFEKIVKTAYFAKRNSETPIVRKIEVHYLVGDSGTGKSYKYAQLCEEFGEGNIYRIADYGTGCFDNYCGENILFLDEFKGDFSYQKLLVLIDKYKTSVQARYSNVTSLWTQIYIASIYPLERLYELMVPDVMRHIDTYGQLCRRVSDVTYHYVNIAGNYCTYTLPMSAYTTYASLIAEATQEPPFPRSDRTAQGLGG